MSFRPPLIHIAVLGALVLPAGEAVAAEASTHFSIFVPPNNSNNGRHSALTVTAHTDNTSVTITDTSEDGDSDDSTSAVLSRGQSIVVRIRDGAVNDGAGGKWDGDRIIIDASQPVTAMLSTRSEWQHDWVPAEGSSMLGTEFFMWTPRANWEINVVGYSDDTQVEIFEVSTSATESSGTTSVSLPGEIVLRQRINRGEDLLTTYNKAGTNITKAGHTYRVVVSRPATVMFGSFFSRERDGGGYVPSESGMPVGQHFYFPVPSGRWSKHEKEIRIVAGANAANVTLRGFEFGTGWVDIDTTALSAYGHADYTGRANSQLKQYDLFEVESDEDVLVFEANWLETGNPGTSDVISYISSLDNTSNANVGREFVAYVGPPGLQSNASGINATLSHLYIAGLLSNTTVTVTDVDTNGTLFNKSATITNPDDIADITMSLLEYNNLNRPNDGIRPYLRISASQPVSVAMANWNDNWLSFAAGVVPSEIAVDIDAPDSLRCDTTVAFTVQVTNTSAQPITGVTLDVVPVGDLEFSGASTSENFTVGTLTGGQSSVHVVNGSVACANADTGELLGVTATTFGTDTNSITVSDRETAATEVTNPGVVGIPVINAIDDNCAIEVFFSTDEDDGNAEFAILRRDFGSLGAYTEIGRVPSSAPAQSGFVYGFRDINVSANVFYQYMVQAIDPSTSNVLSTAGPIVSVPGVPFREVPFSTGVLDNDFADRGIIIDDALNDVSFNGSTVDGYDVDKIAVAYDAYSDSLYLGVSAVGVFGDGDGDGDPDTNTVGASQGITDQPRFSNDEGFAFRLDLDGDSVADAVVGIPFGADLDFVQASEANVSLVDGSPTLAFTTLTAEQAGSLVVDILNEPSAGAPDLELVVRNISTLNSQQAPSNLGVSFYLTAPSVTSDTENAPSTAVQTVNGQQLVTTSCGVPADQIHMGTFAAFGNIFSGTPRFDFVPLGWNNTNSGSVLASPPEPVSGQVVTSPTVFLSDQDVDITATMSPTAISLPTQDMRITDTGMISGNDYLHITTMDWDYSAASGDNRFENFDAQTFRMFVLDCSATVVIEQFGTSGVLRDDRFVRLADGTVQSLGNINPALILAHSGLGTFEVGGAMQRLHEGIPEDWISNLGPEMSPEFTKYSFLDDVSYLGNTVTPESTEVHPLGQSGVTIPAGIWFINHYMWSFANQGSTRIETTFTPGPDCGGSL